MKLKQGFFSSTDSNDTFSLTNSSGLSLGVLSSFNSSDLETSSLYENTLIFLSTVDDEFTLNSETADIELTKNICFDGKEKKPCFIHSLLFINPDTFSPIGSSIISKQDGLYPPITVTKQAKDRMDLAKSFYQHILACPTSNLSLKFAKALGKIAMSSSSTFDMNTIDTYFQQEEDRYKTLDFSSVMTEMSYVNNYAGSWSERKESFTFYLYAPEEASKVTETKAPRFIGSLEFTKQILSSDAINLKEGYNISFKDEKGTTSSVKFTKGFFKAESPILCLAPYLTSQSYLKEDKKFTSLLLGQINGVQVVGVTVKQDLSSKPNVDAQWYVFWHPKNFAQFLTLGMKFTGLLSSIYLTAKFAWRNVNKAKGHLVGLHPLKTSDEIQQERRSLEEQQKKDHQLFAGNNSSPPPSVSQINSKPDEIFSEVRNASIDYFHRMLFVIQFEATHKVKHALEKLPEIIGVDPELLEILWEMNEHEKKLLGFLQSSIPIINNQDDFLKKGNDLIKEAWDKIQKSTSSVLSKIPKTNRDQIEEVIRDLSRLKTYAEIRDQAEEGRSIEKNY